MMSSMSESRDHAPRKPIYKQSRSVTAADMSLPNNQAGSQNEEQAQEQAGSMPQRSQTLLLGLEVRGMHR